MSAETEPPCGACRVLTLPYVFWSGYSRWELFSQCLGHLVPDIIFMYGGRMIWRIVTHAGL